MQFVNETVTDPTDNEIKYGTHYELRYSYISYLVQDTLLFILFQHSRDYDSRVFTATRLSTKIHLAYFIGLIIITAV